MSVDHRALIDTLTDMMSRGHWPALPEVFAPDAVLEYPQSGEVFRGIDNIRGQFGAPIIATTSMARPTAYRNRSTFREPCAAG